MKVELTSKEKIILLVKIVATSVIIYILFKYCLTYIIPFLLAYGLAKLLFPIANWCFTRLNIPKSITAAITLILFAAVLFIIFVYVGGIVIEQLKNLLTNLPIYRQMLWEQISSICKGCDNMLGIQLGTMEELVLTGSIQLEKNISVNLMPSIPQKALNMFSKTAGFFMVIGIMFFMAFMIMLEMERWQNFYRNSIFYKDLCIIGNPLKKVGIAYFKTQFILISLVSIICTAGLFFIGNNYSALLGIFIAIFDAFPILGSGLILVPWAVFELLNKNFLHGAVLLSIYLICQLLRQFLEPRLMGKKIGMHPIVTFMGIYVGIQLFGISGVILGPISLVIIITMIKEYFLKEETEFFRF